MKNLILVILTASILVACDKEETIVYPTYKESVEFSVNTPTFEVDEVLSVAASQNELKSAVINSDDAIEIKDVWMEVTPQNDNSADITTVSIYIMSVDGNELLLADDVVVSVEEGKTIVPLMTNMTNEGGQELFRQLNDGIAGGNSNIELSVKGESFFNDGLQGDVDINMEMFIRYSL